MKGVYNLRPPQVRYVEIWDPTVVLCYLKNLGPAKFLSFKDLTLKLVTLMALVSAQRAQTLHMFDIRFMKKKRNVVNFRLPDPLKQSRPGKSNPVVEFKAYVPNRRLCVVTYIDEYIKRTKPFRSKGKTQFFLSYSKSHHPVAKSTISRWIKTMLYRAGIKDIFTAHSTRAAATSSAWHSAIPLEDILKRAGWSSNSTFANFYKKPIQRPDMANTMLQKA
jgi:hypothetical protein